MKGGMVQASLKFETGNGFLKRNMSHRGHSRQSGQKRQAKHEHKRAMREEAKDEIEQQLEEMRQPVLDESDDREWDDLGRDYWDGLYEDMYPYSSSSLERDLEHAGYWHDAWDNILDEYGDYKDARNLEYDGFDNWLDEYVSSFDKPRESKQGVYVKYYPCDCVEYTKDPELIARSVEWMRSHEKGDVLVMPTEYCPYCS